MNKKQFFSILFAAVFAVTSFMACDPAPDPDPVPDPTPDPQPGLLSNAFEYNGSRTSILSVFSADADDEQWIYFAAVEGATTPSDVEGKEYVAVCIDTGGDDSADEQVFDLKNSDIPFRIVYAKDNKRIIDVSDADRASIESAAFKISFSENEEAEMMLVDFSLVLADGDALRGNALWIRDAEVERMQQTLRINGAAAPVLSAFVTTYAGYYVFTVSTEAAESYDALLDSGAEYFQVLVMPSLLDTTFDVMTETGTFSIFSTFEAAPIEGIGPGYTDGVTSGICCFSLVDTRGNLYAALDLSDGTRLEVWAEGTLAEDPVSENYITINGEERPLRAAFYEVASTGQVVLTFTSGDIEYYEDIENVEKYVELAVDPALMTGNTCDIETVGKPFTIALVDNFTWDEWMTSSVSLRGAAGSFSVAQSGSDESVFTVEMSIDFGGGVTVELGFEGPCTPEKAKPSVVNQYVVEGEPYAIRSAIVDKSGGSVWDIYLSNTADLTTVGQIREADPVLLTCPEAVFTGQNVGFSWYDELSFVYRDAVYSYENNSSGTVRVSLEGDYLTLEFTNYQNLKGTFEGRVTVIE